MNLKSQQLRSDLSLEIDFDQTLSLKPKPNKRKTYYFTRKRKLFGRNNRK